MTAPRGNTCNNKYHASYSNQCYKLCLLGATDKDLTNFFEVDRSTIYNWTSKHAKFARARKMGKLVADAEVVSKLFERAVGYIVKKQKVLNNGKIIEYTEELPPETYAIEYWLKCRNSDKWLHNRKVELSGNTENPLAFILTDISRESESARSLPFDK
ncbi:hypothetical protein ACPV4W_17025 [Vibrio diabolicus]|uniref:hypothetical protein n=1 Tax=Vibrio diabolicus TaxID=50719 RepID=UPI00406758ED